MTIYTPSAVDKPTISTDTPDTVEVNYYWKEQEKNDDKVLERDEYILDGYTIHDSWRASWPKVIARAWSIEQYIADKGVTDLDYNMLSSAIDNAIADMSEQVISELNITSEKDITTMNYELFEKVKEKTINYVNKYDSIDNLNESIQEHERDNIFSHVVGMFLDDIEHFSRNNFYDNILSKVWENKFNDKGKEADLIWYKKLLCHKSEKVLEALMEEGFIVNAMENPPIDFEKNLSSRIIVRKPNQKYIVLPKRCNSGKNLYQNKSEMMSRFKISKMIKHPKKSKTVYHNIVMQEFKNTRKNGWGKVKGLNHVLIMTLPPRPQSPNDFGLAIVDYEASGNVYEFTGT